MPRRGRRRVLVCLPIAPPERRYTGAPAYHYDRMKTRGVDPKLLRLTVLKDAFDTFGYPWPNNLHIPPAPEALTSPLAVRSGAYGWDVHDARANVIARGTSYVQTKVGANRLVETMSAVMKKWFPAINLRDLFLEHLMRSPWQITTLVCVSRSGVIFRVCHISLGFAFTANRAPTSGIVASVASEIISDEYGVIANMTHADMVILDHRLGTVEYLDTYLPDRRKRNLVLFVIKKRVCPRIRHFDCKIIPDWSLYETIPAGIQQMVDAFKGMCLIHCMYYAFVRALNPELKPSTALWAVLYAPEPTRRLFWFASFVTDVIIQYAALGTEDKAALSHISFLGLRRRLPFRYELVSIPRLPPSMTPLRTKRDIATATRELISLGGASPMQYIF